MTLGKIWTDDPRGLSTDLQIIGDVAIGDAAQPVTDLYVTNLHVDNEVSTGFQTAEGFKLLDGSDKNYTLSVYAAGTAYALTATSAALDFGTTDPALVINKAGVYSIRAKVKLNYTGATFAASRTVTLKLRRTNNTAADLTNGTETVLTAVVTTVTATFMVVTLPEVIYTTANLTDAITIFGDVSVIPTAGSLDAASASIVVTRLYA